MGEARRGASGPVAQTSRQRGSALILMPTAVLIVLLLGAISLDQALVLQRQRDLVAACQAAANDGAAAVDRGALYGNGEPRPDLDRALAVARSTITAQGFGDDVRVSLAAPDRLVVEATGEATLVFAPVLPGAGRTRAVHARAEAHLARR